jgi:nucleoside-diphosphate-sugar epimerase
MILVSGGAGVMGSVLVKGLVEAGNKVRVLTLPNDPYVSRLEGVDCEIFYGDVSDNSTLNGAFDSVKIIYHLAAIIIANDPSLYDKVNVNGTRNMVEGGIVAGVDQFIMVSSASVHYPKTTAYSRSKRECEKIIEKQTAMNYTIIHPTLSYNESGGQEFMMFMDYLKKYPIVPFIGRGKSLKNPVHTDDLMKGFLAIPGNPKSYGKTYSFCGSEEITIWDLAKLMLKHQKISKPFLPIPVFIAKFFAAIMGMTMKNPPLRWQSIAGIIQDANLDNTSARGDLRYNPIGISEGMQKCFPI